MLNLKSKKMNSKNRELEVFERRDFDYETLQKELKEYKEKLYTKLRYLKELPLYQG